MRTHVISALGGLVLGAGAVGGAVALVDFEPSETLTAAVLPELAQDFGGAMQLPEGVSTAHTPEAGPSLDVQQDNLSSIEVVRSASPAAGSNVSHQPSASAVGFSPTLAADLSGDVHHAGPETTQPSPEMPPTTQPDPPTTTTPAPAHEQLFDVEVSAWAWDQPWNRQTRVAVTVQNAGNFSGPAEFSMSLPDGFLVQLVPEGCTVAGAQLSCTGRLGAREQMYREVWITCSGSAVSAELPITARLGDDVNQATVTLRCSQVSTPPPAPTQPSA